MKYDTSNPELAREAMSYFMTLKNKKSLIEIKKINTRRSIPQNSYLHLLIAAFGAHFGYTLEEAKQIYKEINALIYAYRKGDNRRVFWRSSADLDKEEMAKSIDRFMTKSADAGYPLPLADDVNWLRQLENEVERTNHYL